MHTFRITKENYELINRALNFYCNAQCIGSEQDNANSLIEDLFNQQSKVQDYKDLSEQGAVALRVAIGYDVIQLLGLKPTKLTGMVQTSTGRKSTQGLGSSIIGILEDRFKRMTT